MEASGNGEGSKGDDQRVGGHIEYRRYFCRHYIRKYYRLN